MRERRRRGVVAVAPLEIKSSDLIPFQSSGLPENAARALDREAISKLVRRLLDKWTEAWYRHRKTITNHTASDPSKAPTGDEA
jgi:hypothetical protein